MSLVYLSQGIEAINVVEHGRSPGYGAWIAVGLVSVSSLAGAWLARRNSARVVVWLAIASATMLVIAMTDLLPDAWREASETGVPWCAIGVSAVVGFVVITYFTRKACGCEADADRTAGRHAPGRHRRLEQAVDTALFSGMGTAAALTTHRAIEGATLALTASAVVVIALMVHSASEGLALAALLDMAKQRLAPWLVVACAAPAVGVLAATIHPLPGKVVPILLSMISGVLTRTAVVGLKLAASKQAGGRLSRRQVTIAGLGALTIGALIVVAHTSENSHPARTRTQPVRLTPSPSRRLPQTQPSGAPQRNRPESSPRVPGEDWYPADPADRTPATPQGKRAPTAPGEPDRGGLILTYEPRDLRAPGNADPGANLPSRDAEMDPQTAVGRPDQAAATPNDENDGTASAGTEESASPPTPGTCAAPLADPNGCQAYDGTAD
jgi:zinc transporter ZupT